MRILWVTNDLPPGSGGIERFVGELAQRVYPEQALVVGPADPDAAERDARQPYRTLRWRGAVLPTAAMARHVEHLAAEHRSDLIVLGAAWPLGELARRLEGSNGLPVVGLSHGLEAGLVQAGLGRLVARSLRHLDVVTAITGWTQSRLQRCSPATRVERLTPGVDVTRYAPDPQAGLDRRSEWGIPHDALVVGCVSRLVRRKGQDRLVELWPRIRARTGAWLVLVGDGPRERALRSHPHVTDASNGILMVGGVEWRELPSCYAAFDLFAMPCRTRLGGLDVEGFGIVYLEAQAAGVPVVAGRSGGAPEALVDRVTGAVVDGRDDTQIADELCRWLGDPELRRRAGHEGRTFARQHDWANVADRLRAIVDTAAGRAVS